MYFIKQYRRGIFNKYYKGMPVFEMFLKDANHALLLFKNWFQNGFRNKILLAYPHYPSRGSTMYKVAGLLGFVVSNRKRRYPDAAVYWEYATFRNEFEFLETVSENVPVVNLQSRDLSKKLVEKVSQKVFGYGTFVDPLTYSGKIVKKNDINAMHDGEIIQGPIQSIESGYIYQRLIDSTLENGEVLVARVLVVNGILSHAYAKYYALEERFKYPHTTKIISVKDLYSEFEIEQLEAFRKAMNLDFGEMDVLRDRHDGKVYVIDVNNTPQAARNSMNDTDRKQSMRQIAEAYKKAFL